MQAFYAAFIPEEGQYAVLFADFELATCGQTMEQAFLMAIDALEGRMAAMADDVEDIPAPSKRDQAMALLQDHYAELNGGAKLPGEAVLQLVPAPDLNNQHTQFSVTHRAR